jgi:hypothetical protein
MMAILIEPGTVQTLNWYVAINREKGNNTQIFSA